MMQPKILENIGQWMSQTFDQVGDFCQVSLITDSEDVVVGAASWPAEDIAEGRTIAAVHRIRGEEGPTVGVAFDRGLWTSLAGHLKMLSPEVIEENLKVIEGPLGEEDLEVYGEIGNVMTGVLNQAIQESPQVEPLQLEFLGPSGFDLTPEGSHFTDDEMVALSITVKADDTPFNATLFLTQNLIDRLFAPLTTEEREADESSPEGLEEGLEDDFRGALDHATPAPYDSAARPWLVIDSSDLDRDHLARLLDERELPWRGIRSIEEGILAMKESWCEGILLDYVVDDGDGLQFLKQLRNNFLTDDLPIIMTARELTRDLVMDAIRAGATHVLVKPVEGEALDKGMERVERLRPAPHF